MLNAFLMEWDGLNSEENSPFILFATNRPFDLDTAVLRRAPVQIHLDMPTAEDRLGIIRLLLRDKTLDSPFDSREPKSGLFRLELEKSTRDDCYRVRQQTDASRYKQGSD